MQRVSINEQHTQPMSIESNNQRTDFQTMNFFPIMLQTFPISCKLYTNSSSVAITFSWPKVSLLIKWLLCTFGIVYVRINIRAGKMNENYIYIAISNGWHDIYTARKFVYGFFLRILYNCIAIIWKSSTTSELRIIQLKIKTEMTKLLVYFFVRSFWRGSDIGASSFHSPSNSISTQY